MEQEQQVEWDGLNKLLQHHGYKPVYFADPIQNKNQSDLVLLDKKSIGEIRVTLRTMLTDSERRETLIHELVKSNNQLKMEAQRHLSQAVQQSQKASKLEGVMDVVKTRVQTLEDSYLGKAVQQHRHRQLQKEKQDAQKQCEILEQKLLKQREETAELQRKLYFTIKEEEFRLAHQTQTFKNICKNMSQHSSAGDQQSVKEESGDVSDTKQKKIFNNLSPSFKTIMKAYQQHQKESETHIEKLKREVENLKQELAKRWPKEDKRTTEADLSAQYHNLLSEISAVLTSPSAPLQPHRQKTFSVAVGPAEFQTLLPTVEVWAQQLHLLKELQQGLNALTARLMPWKPSDGEYNCVEAVKVEDMMLLVDSILENTSTDDKKILKSPTRYTLGSMVSHFQKLFDVTSLSGVYPRMNEVYTRLGEMTNTMKNLRDILDLDTRVPSVEVVNQVAKLVFSTKHSAGFHHMLRDADIDSIIVKVKQHEEFFPAFHTLIIQILQTLGVGRLDDILPTLNSLKQTV